MASTRSEKRRQIVPVRVLAQDKTRRAGDLSGLTIDARPVKMLLGERLTDANLERTVEGSSTLSLNVWDGDRGVLNSSVLGTRLMERKCRVKLDGLGYIINGVGKSGDQLTLTGEDEIVADLKRHGKKNPVRGKNVTAPVFCAMLIRAAGKKVILLDAGSESLKKSSKAQSRRSAGKKLGSVTVKGKRADAQQKRVMHAVLSEASRIKGAKGKPILALVAAIIIECEFKNVQGSGADAISFGVIQAIPGTTAGPKGTFTRAQALDPAYSTRAALLPPGPTSSGGLIAGHKKYPNESIGQMADRAINGLGVGDPGYVGKVDGRKAEAEAIIRAFDAGLLGELTDEGPKPKASAMERKRGESTWACTRRLLEEIGWRVFTREGVVILASEPALYRAPAAMTVDRDTDFWDPDFEWAEGLAVNELSGQIPADRYEADPGETVQVRDPAQVDDKWLLASASVSLVDPDAPVSISLRKPQPPQEASSTEKKTATAGRSEETSLRDRIVEIATASMTSKTGFSRYDQGGALTSDPTPAAGNRTDCSQWVRAVYLRAGAPDPGTWTGDQYAKSKPTNRPKPGDLVLFPRGSGRTHVELYVGPGKRTIGHGSAPIDYGTADMLGGGEYRTFDFLDK